MKFKIFLSTLIILIVNSCFCQTKDETQQWILNKYKTFVPSEWVFELKKDRHTATQGIESNFSFVFLDEYFVFSSTMTTNYYEYEKFVRATHEKSEWQIPISEILYIKPNGMWAGRHILSFYTKTKSIKSVKEGNKIEALQNEVGVPFTVITDSLAERLTKAFANLKKYYSGNAAKELF